MARIRTIKPEFAHSESMGRVSRDARLTFVLLWTIADDSGRLRGNSRMLASLLFPYDNDANISIDKWLGELQHENCIIQYINENNHYIQICNWLNHQRIDKPSPSKIPEFDESSRVIQESSRTVLVGMEGNGRDQEWIDPDAKLASKRRKKFIVPSQAEVVEYCQLRGKGVDPQKWFDHYSAKGWKIGKNSMVDWKAAIRTWEKGDSSNIADDYAAGAL